jgi:hypothetical protein
MEWDADDRILLYERDSDALRLTITLRHRPSVIDEFHGWIAVAGRGHDRNKGTSTRSMIVRNIRQPRCLNNWSIKLGNDKFPGGFRE